MIAPPKKRRPGARLPILDVDFKTLESKACEGKRAHLSYREALKEAKRMYEHFSEQVDAYQCTFCLLFHVGHRPQERTRGALLQRLKERQDGYSVGWLED
jgi:hypothetical protein